MSYKRYRSVSHSFYLYPRSFLTGDLISTRTLIKFVLLAPMRPFLCPFLFLESISFLDQSSNTHVLCGPDYPSPDTFWRQDTYIFQSIEQSRLLYTENRRQSWLSIVLSTTYFILHRQETIITCDLQYWWPRKSHALCTGSSFKMSLLDFISIHDSEKKKTFAVTFNWSRLLNWEWLVNFCLLSNYFQLLERIKRIVNRIFPNVSA